MVTSYVPMDGLLPDSVGVAGPTEQVIFERVLLYKCLAFKVIASTIPENIHRWGKEHCTAGLQFNKTGTDQ